MHVVSLLNIGTVLLLMNVTFSSYRPVVSLVFVFKLDTFKEGVANTGSLKYNICPLRYRYVLGVVLNWFCLNAELSIEDNFLDFLCCNLEEMSRFRFAAKLFNKYKPLHYNVRPF